MPQKQYDWSTLPNQTGPDLSTLPDLNYPLNPLEDIWNEINTSWLPKQTQSDVPQFKNTLQSLGVPDTITDYASYIPRFGEWAYEKVARPLFSPLPAATVAAAASFPEVAAGAAIGGIGLGAYGLYKDIPKFLENPTFEGGLDVGLDTSMIVPGLMRGKSAYDNTIGRRGGGTSATVEPPSGPGLLPGGSTPSSPFEEGNFTVDEPRQLGTGFTRTTSNAGSSIPSSGLPDVVTIKNPTIDFPFWQSKGYVVVPGLRDAEGYPQMVRPEVADLYRQPQKSPQQQAGPEPPEFGQNIPNEPPNVIPFPEAPPEAPSFAPRLPTDVGRTAVFTGPGRIEVFDPVDGKPIRSFTTQEEADAFIANHPNLDSEVAGEGWPRDHPLANKLSPEAQDAANMDRLNRAADFARSTDIPMGQPPGGGAFMPPVVQPQDITQQPGLPGMGPVPLRGAAPQMPEVPQAVRPDATQQMLPYQTMDPRMAARAGSPQLGPIQPPPQQGNLLPMEVRQPGIEQLDNALQGMRENQRLGSIAGQPQPQQQQLDLGPSPEITDFEPRFQRELPKNPLTEKIKAIARMTDVHEVGDMLIEYSDRYQQLRDARKSGQGGDINQEKEARWLLAELQKQFDSLQTGVPRAPARNPFGGGILGGDEGPQFQRADNPSDIQGLLQRKSELQSLANHLFDAGKFAEADVAVKQLDAVEAALKSRTSMPPGQEGPSFQRMHPAIPQLKAEIAAKTQQAKQLLGSGKIPEAIALIKEVDGLNGQLDTLINAAPPPVAARGGEGAGMLRTIFNDPSFPGQPQAGDTPEIAAKRKELLRLDNQAGDLSPRQQKRYEKLLSDLNPEGEQPLFARAPGGGLTASANLTRTVMNITGDYTGSLAGIMNREGMQNHLDAADKLGEGGIVKIRFSARDNTMEIYDNGSGLDEDGLSNKLVEVFATGKEGDAGATGGKGIGSASYIYGAAHFEIDTVAVDAKDGKKYRIKAGGTPEQFLDPVKGSDWDRQPVGKWTPTGTTITVELKGDQDLNDAKDMLTKIMDYTRDRPSSVIIDMDNNTRGTSLKDVEEDPDEGPEIEKFGESKNDKLIGDFTTQNRNSHVRFLVPTFDDSIARGHYLAHFLNNGMYQFTKTVDLPQMGEGVPPVVLVNIEPLVDDLNPQYPFINTREDIKDDIRVEIDNFLKDNVTRPGIEKRKNRVQELYDTMIQTTIPGTRRKAMFYDPGDRFTPDERAEFLGSPLFAELTKHYDQLIDSILGAVGRSKWIDRLEGVGIVVDPNMNGVHIPNPTTGKSTILFNPWARAEIGMTPQDNGWKGTITGLHEVGHIGDESRIPWKLSAQDAADPRVTEFMSDFINHMVEYGDVGYQWTGHGMDFVQRLGDVYAKTGIQRTYDAAARLTDIFTGGRSQSSSYSPEFQRLLQLYQDSRGRDAVTEDLLSGTGVKQANRGRRGTGGIPNSGGPNGGRTPPGGSIYDMNVAGRRVRDAFNRTMDEQSLLSKAKELARSASTTGDLSTYGRQGLALINTPEYWKAAWQGFKGFSKEAFDEMDADLRDSDLMRVQYDSRDRRIPSMGDIMGLRLFTPASQPGEHAERMTSAWLETGGDVPVASAAWRHTAGKWIRMTNRANITFLNHLMVNRAQFLLDRMKDISANAEQTGEARFGRLGGIDAKKVDPEQAQELDPYKNNILAREIGDFINTAIGHAPLKTRSWRTGEEMSAEPIRHLLNWTLFSPRLQARNVRMLNPATYIMANPFVRRQYLKAALATGAAWFASVYMIKKAMEDRVSINTDMTSADFGKARFGNFRLDLGGGFQQYLVAMARAYEGGARSAANNIFRPFGQGYRPDTQLTSGQRFASNKLDPTLKLAYDFLNASKRQPFYVGDRIAQLYIPLVAQDLKALAEYNPSLLPWMGPAFFGAGSQIYDKNEVDRTLVPHNWDLKYTGEGLHQGVNKIMNYFK